MAKDDMQKEFHICMTKEFHTSVTAPNADHALRAALEKDTVEWDLVAVSTEVSEVEEFDEEE